MNAQPVNFFILLLLPPKEANKRQQEALSEAFIAVECAKQSVVHLVEMLIDHLIDLHSLSRRGKNRTDSQMRSPRRVL